nr:K(+)/H(+) antiporter 1-like [Arachis hypogaea]
MAYTTATRSGILPPSVALKVCHPSSSFSRTPSLQPLFAVTDRGCFLEFGVRRLCLLSRASIAALQNPSPRFFLNSSTAVSPPSVLSAPPLLPLPPVQNPSPLFLCFSVRGLEQFAVGSPLSVVSPLAVLLSVEAVGIALSERKARYSYASLWVLLSSLAFVVVCILVFRPLVSWMIHKTPEEQPFSETQICIVLTGVMISAFITDALEAHAVFGAFVYGLVIPNGPLAAAIIEKLEDFVSGLLLPLFFAISGLKTNLTLIKGTTRWGFVVLMVPLVVSLLFQIPVMEGVILGLLMNTKGFIEIIVLNYMMHVLTFYKLIHVYPSCILLIQFIMYQQLIIRLFGTAAIKAADEEMEPRRIVVPSTGAIVMFCLGLCMLGDDGYCVGVVGDDNGTDFWRILEEEESENANSIRNSS